eukprot:14779879-Ditylum_brightwellii.AAC.1
MLSRYRKRDHGMWEVRNSSQQAFSTDYVLVDEIDDLIPQYHEEPLSNQDFILGMVSSSYSQALIKVPDRQNGSHLALPETNNHRDILFDANISEIDIIFQKILNEDEQELDEA